MTYKIKGHIYHRLGVLKPRYMRKHTELDRYLKRDEKDVYIHRKGTAEYNKPLPKYLDLYFYCNSEKQIQIRANQLTTHKPLSASTKKRRSNEEKLYSKNFEIVSILQGYLITNNAVLKPLLKGFKGVVDLVDSMTKHLNKLPDVRITLRTSEGKRIQQHKGTYDLPKARAQVGAIVDFDELNVPKHLEVVLSSPKEDSKHSSVIISSLNYFYNPMQYPLLIPNGDVGYSFSQKKLKGYENKKFVVDNYVKIETFRLSFFEANQRNIRKESFDVLQNDDPSSVGQRIIIPPSFVGEPRYMKQKQQDALTFIECQKRGLPHCHVLLWLEHKIDKTDIDNYISVEIPDPNTSPRLYKIVTTNMIHNPCVGYDESSPCIVKNKCSKNFPKPYRKGTFCIVYVTKYVNKGSDSIIYSKSDGKPVNEIRNYRDARYVNAIEATWRISNFHIHKSYPPVTYLPVHLGGEHNIFYVEKEASMSVEHQLAKVTQLMAFFKLCENDVFARTLLCTEVPTYYVFCKKSSVWTERSRGSISIGRMQTTNSKNAERFYLRLMLSHVRGSKSFSDIWTVEGVEYATYREVVKAMGLMKDKDHWEKTLMEIVNHTNNGKDLRSTYATMLVFCDLEDQSEVWLDIRDYFASDFLYKSGKTHYNDEIYLDALDEIQEYVYNCGGVDITKYGLPASRGLEKSFNLLRREKSYNTVQLIEDVREKLPMLNKEQREIFDAVIGVVGGKIAVKERGSLLTLLGGQGKVSCLIFYWTLFVRKEELL
ncbi:uncharacterized protein LOC143033569 [Oratosquilla oratoria]|uniref:uncharacterized protein LOC143033569 n=1 Tax=Oratosquilla oratoria TaxID=337810 RepID=UPI003F75835F